MLQYSKPRFHFYYIPPNFGVKAPNDLITLFLIKENFQSKFHSVRSTGPYHEKLLGLELTMRVFLVERAHHGFSC